MVSVDSTPTQINGDDCLKLKNFKVANAPDTVYYIPNFISQQEEDHILKNVYSVPKPKWTCLKNRKLQDWGGIPHKNGMITEDIPSWLRIYMDRVSELNAFNGKSANHVLVNEYNAGQGIMPHLDGPLFFPTITTISCGSHTILEFFKNDTERREKVCDLILERRSLVVLKDDMYTKYLHSISEIESDEVKKSCVNVDLCKDLKIGGIYARETRISLTIRNVPKVAKFNMNKILKI